jgi:glycosyltransferase involved in cell wall biosynthesis
MYLFSIILPTYNRAHLLSDCIGSVCSQTYTHWELIIVDDGSTDESIDVVEQFKADNRIQYIFQPNKGVSAARNTGIRHSKGDYVVFLDSDDHVTDSWLLQFATALDNRRTDLVFFNYYRNLSGAEQELINNRPDTKGNWGSYIPGTFLISRELLLKAGLYDEQLKFGENTELSWRIMDLQPTYQYGAAATLIYNASETGGRNNLQNRIDSFYHLIEKHEQKFTTNPALAQNYYQVAGVDSIKIGEKTTGQKLLWKGYTYMPFNIRALFRYLRTYFFSYQLQEEIIKVENGNKPNYKDKGVGVFIITYKRNEILLKTIDSLFEQTVKPDSILIIDNGADEALKTLLETKYGSLVAYYSPGYNSGPAGGAYYGLKKMASTNNEFIIWVDDDDPPQLKDAIKNIISFMNDHPDIHLSGLVGTKYSRTKGETVRISDGDLKKALVEVDNIGGGQMMTIRRCILSEKVLPNKELFFGFEELDFTLKLKRSGFKIAVPGELFYHMRKMNSRLNLSSSDLRKMANHVPIWRRYYSLRNLVYIALYEEHSLTAVGYQFIKSIYKTIKVPNNRGIFLKAFFHGLFGKIGMTLQPERKF